MAINRNVPILYFGFPVFFFFVSDFMTSRFYTSVLISFFLKLWHALASEVANSLPLQARACQTRLMERNQLRLPKSTPMNARSLAGQSEEVVLKERLESHHSLLHRVEVQ